MISEFPVLKKIEVTDKQEIENLTKDFPPYSDFNFTSMWSWDVDNNLRISKINGNLVVKFADYITGESFLSFIGTKEVNKTIKSLLDYSKKTGLRSHLRLIPEAVAREIKDEIFISEEDRDNFDYILSTEELATYCQYKHRSRRKSVNKFKNQYPEHKVGFLKIKDVSVQAEIKELFKRWMFIKGNDEFETIREYQALCRFFKLVDHKNIVSLGIYIKDDLVGFCLSEILSQGYAISHFWKANLTVSKGIYALLIQETAKILKKEGCEYLNIEQDVGIPNLRIWKTLLCPHAYLKKYICKQNNYDL